jgi:hypothetical protein
MAKVSNPVLFILLVTALSLLGINLSLQSARANDTDSAPPNQTDSAHADNCLAAPNASAPKGQHWYYRTDRQKGRKCWYLHAAAPLAHHAAARHRSSDATSAVSTAPTQTKPAAPEVAAPAAPPTETQPAALEVAAPAPPPMNTEPAPEAASAAATVSAATASAATAEAAPPATAAAPVADAAPPAGPADGVQPQPHIEILKTVPLGIPTQPSAPATQVAPAAQGESTTAVSNETSTGSADAVPSNTGSDAKTAPAPSAVHNAGPDADRSGSDAAQQKPAEAPGLVDTIATLQPTEMFFLLAIGLSMVVFLIAIASRIAAKRREPIITDYPDSAWSNDQFDAPRVAATQIADEATDERWIDEEQDVAFIDPQGLNDPHERDWIEQSMDLKSLEPVFRILRQA